MKCLWSRNPWRTERGTYKKSYTFDKPGTYEIHAKQTWQMRCSNAVKSGVRIVTVHVLPHEFGYTLRGSTGEEEVRINDGTERLVTMTKEETKFKSPSRVVLVEFTNDARTAAGDRNVYLASDFHHNIVAYSGQVLRNWATWKCGSTNEDTACNVLRRGVFAWQGTYKVTFSGEGEDKVGTSATRRLEQDQAVADYFQS